MNKQNVVHLYNGILFRLKREWSIDIYYNMMGRPQKHAKWKKFDTKDHIPHDSICKKFLEDVNP